MAFGDQNKKNERATANTFGGVTGFNNQSEFDKSMFKMDFWADKITLILYPELPTAKRKPNGPVYDKESAFKAFISKDKARTLAVAFKRIIAPVLKGEVPQDNSNAEVGVKVGSAYLGLGTGSKYKCGPYMILSTLDEEGYTTSSIGHEFVKTSAIIKYDQKEGKFTEQELENKIFEFVDGLKEFDSAMTFAQAHASREANAYDRASDKAIINSILTGLGLGSKTSGGRTSFGGGRQVGGSARATESNVEDFEDIAAELEAR